MHNIKIKPICFFLLFLIAISVVFVIYAARLNNFQASLVPISAASLIIFLALIELIKEIKKSRKEARTKEPEEVDADVEKTTPGVFGYRVALLAAWVAGLTGGIYYLGFLITNPIFIFSFLKTRGTGWVTSFLISAIISAVLYGFFELLLERRLWRGQLFL